LKRRQEWFDGQLDLDPARLVFIDETGLSTKMSRLRGRALRGGAPWESLQYYPLRDFWRDGKQMISA
jgi:hypothetical protein